MGKQSFSNFLSIGILVHLNLESSSIHLAIVRLLVVLLQLDSFFLSRSGANKPTYKY